MTLGSIRRLSLASACALGLAGCTTAAYEPSVGELSAATRAIGPLVSGESSVLRKDYRQSLINLGQAGTPVNLGKFVCEPLGYTSGPLGSGSELSEFGNSARNVARAPRSRGWADLVGSLFESYEMPPPRPIEQLQESRIDAYSDCMTDVEAYPGVDAFLLEKVGATAVPAGGRSSMEGAVTGIIEIVEPAILDALDTIDEHRRAAALRAFFADPAKVAGLKAHVRVLRDFFTIMDKYRRLRAMQAIALAGQQQASGNLVSLAATYDTVFAVQMRLAFEDMDRSIDAMAAVASGDDEGALIFSAKDAAIRTIRAVDGIRELTEDGPQKERLQRLLDQLQSGGRPPEPRRR
ncbi:MAG: hypothetical protein ACK59B_03805 [Alphaproteobacteria bacterium]